jgi:hypothetical protein
MKFFSFKQFINIHISIIFIDNQQYILLPQHFNLEFRYYNKKQLNHKTIIKLLI